MEHANHYEDASKKRNQSALLTAVCSLKTSTMLRIFLQTSPRGALPCSQVTADAFESVTISVATFLLFQNLGKTNMSHGDVKCDLIFQGRRPPPMRLQPPTAQRAVMVMPGIINTQLRELAATPTVHPSTKPPHDHHLSPPLLPFA